MESVKQIRLRTRLRDPGIGSFLSTTVTGEHYMVASGMHVTELYQLAPFCSEPDRRRSIVDIWVEEWRERPLHEPLDILLGIGTGGMLFLHEMQLDPEFKDTKVMWLDKVADPEERARLNTRRARLFGQDIDSRRPEFVLGRNFKIYPDKRVGLVEDVTTTGRSFMAARDACSDPTGWDIEREEGPQEVNIVSAFVAIDRSPASQMELPKRMRTITVITALRDPLPIYPPNRCPLCAKGIPLKRI